MNKAGEWGEIYVARDLRKKGVDILATNYYCRFGEADIIYLEKQILVVVEVKARSGDMIATPGEFVTEQKQKKLALTTKSFLAGAKMDLPVRFDVAEVYFPQADNYKEYKINYIKDAFRIR